MIHEQLARIRKQHGMTQAEVAEALDLPQGLISNYEKGARRLHAELIVRFAQLYDVSTDELLAHQPKRRNSKSEFGLHLVKRMQQIEKLPKNRQKAVLHSIDLLISGANTKQHASA
jgi:transcriptional regulator with XRE-family HTH domain